MRTNDITLLYQNPEYAVYQDKNCVGVLQLYENPCHQKNCYVRLKMNSFDPQISAVLFDRLKKIAKRPLQVMAHSDNTALTDFLRAGGFQCRRKCYEIEAAAKDYIGGNADVQLLDSCRGKKDYENSCRMMLEYYVKTHKAVNPWTADFDMFCTKMPGEVICAKAGGQIASLAFVEGNEIAYLCGANPQHFVRFAHSLVKWMLEQYETVCLECDDCDWAAMIVRSLFQNQSAKSLDTYIAD